jgi:hypothetical protein
MVECHREASDQRLRRLWKHEPIGLLPDAGLRETPAGAGVRSFVNSMLPLAADHRRKSS